MINILYSSKQNSELMIRTIISLNNINIVLQSIALCYPSVIVSNTLDHEILGSSEDYQEYSFRCNFLFELHLKAKENHFNQMICCKRQLA